MSTSSNLFKIMPTVLQLNVTANWGSTGRIAEQINATALEHGWDCYFAYGRYATPSKSHLIKVGSSLNVYSHYISYRILDNEGLSSFWVTKKLIRHIKKLKPDIIHLHNLHDHWINYRCLFEFLNSSNIKVVWTFHDFWAITGHCCHFIKVNCKKWMTMCNKCPLNNSLIDNSFKNFNLKKELFTNNHNLHIVAVSQWVADRIKDSFLSDKDIRVISNGVNIDIFKPNYNNLLSFIPSDKFIILGVASQWKSGKGLSDYISMSKLLTEEELIVLVGVDDKLKKTLPKNIIGIKRTNNQEELASLYSRANVVTSFSSAETFGLSIVEAYACGTPVVVYDNTAQPYLVNHNTGFVVPDKDYVAAYSAIQKIKRLGKQLFSDSCIRYVKGNFCDKNIYLKYLNLYNELLENK